MIILKEKTIDQGTPITVCPCGCGFKSQDRALLRIRLIELDGGQRQLETMRSADGGGVWYGMTWRALKDPTSAKFLRELGEVAA